MNSDILGEIGPCALLSVVRVITPPKGKKSTEIFFKIIKLYTVGNFPPNY